MVQQLKYYKACSRSNDWSNNFHQYPHFFNSQQGGRSKNRSDDEIDNITIHIICSHTFTMQCMTTLKLIGASVYQKNNLGQYDNQEIALLPLVRMSLYPLQQYYD